MLDHRVADVAVDGGSVGAVTKYVFSRLTADHSIRAEFVHDCPSRPFGDVDILQWYHECVDYVLKAGLFRGVSETAFAPDDP